jgi:hypothetical protein
MWEMVRDAHPAYDWSSECLQRRICVRLEQSCWNFLKNPIARREPTIAGK